MPTNYAEKITTIDAYSLPALLEEIAIIFEIYVDKRRAFLKNSGNSSGLGWRGSTLGSKLFRPKATQANIDCIERIITSVEEEYKKYKSPTEHLTLKTNSLEILRNEVINLTYYGKAREMVDATIDVISNFDIRPIEIPLSPLTSQESLSSFIGQRVIEPSGCYDLSDVSRTLTRGLSKNPRAQGRELLEEHKNQYQFDRTNFTDPLDFDPTNYMLLIHIVRSLERVVSLPDYKIKEEDWLGNVRVLSTSVVTQRNYTQWGNYGFSLAIDPRRVLISSYCDLSFNLQTRQKHVAISEVQSLTRATMDSPILAVRKQLEHGTNWNEILIRGDKQNKQDTNPLGTLQINGVVIYKDKADSQEMAHAQKIARANKLPLLELSSEPLELDPTELQSDGLL
ncbi:hypothetical protein [Fangia hongkongensis]|uniref:hypothetical protein n=1 Tax=Fangia hongkongensis TaxID=270495 RepID=UPI0003791306|nr:hypothetical protein [Fangia hongkongensis]MBK2125628.1 hypothetical protein [Fangia hongkongensis]